LPKQSLPAKSSRRSKERACRIQKSSRSSMNRRHAESPLPQVKPAASTARPLPTVGAGAIAAGIGTRIRCRQICTSVQTLVHRNL
jgi:hypothetical protein